MNNQNMLRRIQDLEDKYNGLESKHRQTRMRLIEIEKERLFAEIEENGGWNDCEQKLREKSVDLALELENLKEESKNG